ncbi:WD repeat domain 34 [Pelomyxa schiedti]|nr:WD repeat domain 34 [Pelomyxa schiedti]
MEGSDTPHPTHQWEGFDVEIGGDELEDEDESGDPDVCEQLDANLTSHVFDNYVATWDETADSIQQTANLKFAHPEAQEYACTSVSWSCTGSILASAHGVPTHSGWCSHRGYANMWAVFKKSLRNQTKPQLVVELGSCAMCILCHPLRPSIVAVGTFNGEIVLIDVDATEDPTIGTTNLNDVNAHREPVTALCWLTSGRSKTTELASSSGDGKVIVWAWENIRGAGKLSIARLMHLKGRSDQATLVAGLSAMSFFCQEVNHLVVGTEGGKLMKCSIMAPLAVGREKATPHASTTTNAAAAAAAQAPPIQSSGSVQFNYEDLRLPIFCIAASPSHPNVFLSTCADGAVRLHNALVSKPNIVLVPPGGESTTPLCVAWSTTRPTVFATGCSDGFLHIYDLSHPEGTIRPVASVCVSKNSAVTSVAFSGGSVQGYIATSTNKGIVKIWQLSHHLVFLRPDDSAILASHGTLKANKGS